MSGLDKAFLGADHIIWFIGKVESRADPLAIGRVRVRAYGWHTSSLAEIPSEDLPWATVIQSTDSGATPCLKEGDTVIGMFIDGRSAQVPLIIGLLPGYNVENNTGIGFNDLRSEEELKKAPRKPDSWNYKVDGSGIVVDSPDTASRYPLPEDLQRPTLSGASRYDVANTVVQTRKENLDKGVVSADGLTWDEPYPAYNSLYPYNHVIETESGHLFELDDTPDNERIAITHRTGSFLEFYPSGSVVEKITKSKYQIILGDDYIHVMGSVIITVGQDAHIRVEGNAKVEVGNDLDAKVSGGMNLSVKENLNIKVGGDFNLDVAGEAAIISGEDQYLTSGGATHVKASGVARVSSGGIMELTGSEVVVGGGSVTLDAPTTEASAGSPAAIDDAAARATATTGQPDPEPIPVPLGDAFKLFDAYTGSAYNQGQFLDDNDDVPDANTVPAANTTGNTACGYEEHLHTFLPKSRWAISSAGLIALQNHEGFGKQLANGMVQCYPDPGTGSEPFTVGWGTTSAVLNGVTLTPNTVVSKAQCQTWLNYSITSIFVPSIKRYIKVELTQGMVDAVISFVYNVGATNFKKSGFLACINKQDWCGAYAALQTWNKANKGKKALPGLTKRRKAEGKLFLS